MNIASVPCRCGHSCAVVAARHVRHLREQRRHRQHLDVVPGGGGVDHATVSAVCGEQVT